MKMILNIEPKPQTRPRFSKFGTYEDPKMKAWRRQCSHAQAWVNGYTVEGEPRYMVRIKGIDDRYDVLNYGTYLDEWTIDDAEGAKGVRITHTRKELEDAGFGWIFSCEGVEVKEGTDGND